MIGGVYVEAGSFFASTCFVGVGVSTTVVDEVATISTCAEDVAFCGTRGVVVAAPEKKSATLEIPTAIFTIRLWKKLNMDFYFMK